MNDFLSLAQKRYAVRSYLPKPVEAEKLERILEAGRVAPTAKNTQPFRFLVVLGLGSCWLMHFDPAPIREQFRIPEGTEPEYILAIGYPAEDSHPSERHTKRKPLEDLVVEESF